MSKLRTKSALYPKKSLQRVIFPNTLKGNVFLPTFMLVIHVLHPTFEAL